MIWIFIVVPIAGAVLGALESRGVGVGITLFEGMWCSFILCCLFALFAPGAFRTSRPAMKAYAFFVFFLCLVQAAIAVCIVARADNELGYIAKDSLAIRYFLPGTLAVLALAGIIRLILSSRD